MAGTRDGDYRKWRLVDPTGEYGKEMAVSMTEIHLGSHFDNWPPGCYFVNVEMGKTITPKPKTQQMSFEELMK